MHREPDRHAQARTQRDTSTKEAHKTGTTARGTQTHKTSTTARGTQNHKRGTPARGAQGQSRQETTESTIHPSRRSDAHTKGRQITAIVNPSRRTEPPHDTTEPPSIQRQPIAKCRKNPRHDGAVFQSSTNWHRVTRGAKPPIAPHQLSEFAKRAECAKHT